MLMPAMSAMSATQLQHTPLFLTISQVIQSLDSDLTTFRNCIETIGTAHDNSENRRELKRLRSVIKRKIADSESKLKEDSGKYVTHSLPWLHIPPSLPPLPSLPSPLISALSPPTLLPPSFLPPSFLPFLPPSLLQHMGGPVLECSSESPQCPPLCPVAHERKTIPQ